MFPDVRYHMDIVRKVIGTRRELWIAREVSCNRSGAVSAHINGDLRGLWGTRSPTHEAWSGVAVLPEVRYHVDIVRQVAGTRRELGIAWEVSCESSVSASPSKRARIRSSCWSCRVARIAAGRPDMAEHKRHKRHKLSRLGHRCPLAAVDIRRPRRTVCAKRWLEGTLGDALSDT